MSSNVSIANAALIILGARLIISLEDDDPKATALNERFDAVRDAELRRHRWRFSIKRKALAADSETPISGFNYLFTLPSDCLRLLEIGDYHFGGTSSDYVTSSTAPYAIEGNQILTNLAAPLNVRYIRRVTDPGSFDSCFSESLAARLAYECCERITQSTSKREDCLQAYQMALREARTANALERPSEQMSDDTWLTARRG